MSRLSPRSPAHGRRSLDINNSVNNHKPTTIGHLPRIGKSLDIPDARWREDDTNGNGVGVGVGVGADAAEDNDFVIGDVLGVDKRDDGRPTTFDHALPEFQWVSERERERRTSEFTRSLDRGERLQRSNSRPRLSLSPAALPTSRFSSPPSSSESSATMSPTTSNPTSPTCTTSPSLNHVDALAPHIKFPLSRSRSLDSTSDLRHAAKLERRGTLQDRSLVLRHEEVPNNNTSSNENPPQGPNGNAASTAAAGPSLTRRMTFGRWYLPPSEWRSTQQVAGSSGGSGNGDNATMPASAIPLTRVFHTEKPEVLDDVKRRYGGKAFKEYLVEKGESVPHYLERVTTIKEDRKAALALHLPKNRYPNQGQGSPTESRRASVLDSPPLSPRATEDRLSNSLARLRALSTARDS